MSNNEKIFYKCLGFQTKEIKKKPLFFYHVPKCAGTTFCVLISHLFNKSHRLKGPLFLNNDKKGVTAYANFLKDEKLINNSKLGFLYGHVPFEINKKINYNFLTATLIREPLQRCISHYTWGIQKGYFSLEDDLEKLFQLDRLPPNVLVNQFSGKGLSEPNNKDAVDYAFDNLKNKIDLVFDTSDINKLLNLIISSFDLPNLFYQKQQVQLQKYTLNNKAIKIIEKNNEKDLILYNKLIENKIIKNYDLEEIKYRKCTKFLYSSPSIMINNKKTIFLDNKQFKSTEKQFTKLNYKIIED